MKGFHHFVLFFSSNNENFTLFRFPFEWEKD